MVKPGAGLRTISEDSDTIFDKVFSSQKCRSTSTASEAEMIRETDTSQPAIRLVRIYKSDQEM